MTAQTAVAGAVQLGGLALAPPPRAHSALKARSQVIFAGRRAAALPRVTALWRKSGVAIEGASAVYDVAPAVVAASVAAAVLLVPAAAHAPNWGVGHDALALAGLLALARFAVAAASWDVGNGFSLIGASRDLTISPGVEVTLIPSARRRRTGRGHDRTFRGIVAGTPGTGVRSTLTLALGAFRLRTGRGG